MSKLTDKIELIGWLRFKKFALPTLQFSAKIIDDLAMFIVFMFVSIVAIASYSSVINDDVFRQASSIAALTFAIAVIARLLNTGLRMFNSSVRATIYSMLRSSVSLIFVIAIGANLTTTKVSYSLTLLTIVLLYLLVNLSVKLVIYLDKSIQSSIWNFDHLLDDLSELKVDEIVDDKYKDYEFNIIRQSRSNIKYYALNMISKDDIIRYDLDIEVKRKESNTTYLLNHASHLTERNKSKLSC